MAFAGTNGHASPSVLCRNARCMPRRLEPPPCPYMHSTHCDMLTQKACRKQATSKCMDAPVRGAAPVSDLFTVDGKRYTQKEGCGPPLHQFGCRGFAFVLPRYRGPAGREQPNPRCRRECRQRSSMHGFMPCIHPVSTIWDKRGCTMIFLNSFLAVTPDNPWLPRRSVRFLLAGFLAVAT